MNKSLIHFTLITILFGCSNTATRDEGKGTLDQQEKEILYSAQINTTVIERLLDKIKSGHYKNIHSLLVSKNNQLIIEEYFDGKDGRRFRKFNKDDLHEWRSVTKSITSLLIGIAIDQGFIDSVDEPVASFFPEYSDLIDTKKKDILIKDLLTMRSGISWDQRSTPHSKNDEGKMESSQNFLKYVLSRPMAEEPGTSFNYNSGNTILLAGIIKNASGMHVNEFADKYLFSPLGIKEHSWWISPGNLPEAHAGLIMRPNDMIKIGNLLLNKGWLNDAPIIPEEWIVESTKDHVLTPNHYGYQWWRRTFTIDDIKHSTFFAAGNGGQFMFCFQDLGLVVVLTAGNYGQNVAGRQVMRILKKDILPALFAPR